MTYTAKKDLADAERGGGPDTAPPPVQHHHHHHHHWESDVFTDGECPNDIKARCKFSGAPRGLVGREPLLLAVVEGVGLDGQPFVWIARRARKRVLQPHQCSRPQPPVTWLGSLSLKHWGKPGWWVAALFGLGSLLFLISGIARQTNPVGYPDRWPPGLGSLSAALGPWPEVVACYVMYFPAVIIQVLEATNLDYSCRCRKALEGRPPPPRLLPGWADLHTVSWWTAALQVLGILGFMVGTTVDLMGMERDQSSTVQKWGILFAFFFGGTVFTAASLLACLEETGSWWRGIVPTRWSDVISISWLAVFSAFYGSVCFMIQGFGFFVATFSWEHHRALDIIGGIVGSLFFIVSAGAGLLEQANPGHL